MVCEKCGTPINDASSFCSFCGAPVKIILDQTGSDQQSAANKNDSLTAADNITTQESVNSSNSPNRILLIGKVLATFGIVSFMLIVLVSLAVYHKVYLYNGYQSTRVLCTICLVSMILGIIGIVSGLIINKNKASGKSQKRNLAFPVVSLVLAVVLTTTLSINAANNTRRSSSHSGSSSYEMDHATYCLLYIQVKNVKVTHTRDYAYVSGQVTNTGTYQVKYVKVRAACKDSRGNTIDTDWTYAVDSDWLNPGESKTFEMMVKDTGNTIKSATVTVVYD